MPRSFYSFALFFTVLYIGVAILKSAVFFILGLRAGELSLLGGLLAFEFLVSLVWSLILLKYFLSKGYRFASGALAVSIILSIVVLLLQRSVLSTKQFSDPYIVAMLASLISGIVYAGSLVVSRASEKPWLRGAGIMLLMKGLIVLSSIIWALNSTTFMLGGSMAKVEQWAALPAILAYAFFAINFAHEKAAAKDPDETGGGSLTTIMGLAAFAALFFGVFFGVRVVTESIAIVKGTKRADKNLKEPDQPFEAHTFSSSHGEKLLYRLLKPLNYDSTKKYPLVVCLHGSSGRGSDNIKQVGTSLTAEWLSDYDNRVKYPAFIFVPQCPVEKSWGGLPDLPAIDSLVFETIHDLERKLPIDKDRRYITGISLGGYGVWHFITTRPGMFAAAIPISGAGDSSLAQKCIDIPVWAFHGAKDRNVPAKGSRLMIDAMEKAGGTPLYTEYPDAAHAIGERVKNTPGLLDWLFGQKQVTEFNSQFSAAQLARGASGKSSSTCKIPGEQNRFVGHEAELGHWDSHRYKTVIEGKTAFNLLTSSVSPAPIPQKTLHSNTPPSLACLLTHTAE